MSWRDIVAWVIIGTTSLTGLVMFLTNIKKLKEFINDLVSARRGCLAVKLYPYLEPQCSAIQLMPEIRQALKEIKQELADTKVVSVKTLGSDLIRNSDSFVKQGYMPQPDKDAMMNDFIVYFCADGNGIVFQRVENALNLPTYEGGEHYNIDISAIVEREKRKHEMKKQMEV